MTDKLKILDSEGVKVLWKQISLQDYPNNETLIAVIDAIDATKADKQELEENYLKKSDSGDIKIEGEIQADNVPHIVEEKILCTIPAATIQEAITNEVKDLTVDAFEHDPSIIVYATYGGKEYASFENQENYLEFFVANPYVTDGFACSFQLGVDADGNADETKAKFNYRVLDSENITDLVLTQLIVNTIDSKYFDHDFTVINSISMNRRGDIGTYSTALGGSCVATGSSSFANGLACEATGAFSTAVGKGTFATGEAGLSTGLMTTAGREAFSNGRYCEATGRGSLATGNSSKATGQYSTAEGQSTTASGSYSHTEGQSTAASKTASHAEGLGTLASSNYQHVEGKYNIEDTATKYAHIVGNGTDTSARSNAYTVDWDGNLWAKGNIKIGGTSQDDEAATAVATQEQVETLYKTLSSDRVLRFYCVEDVTITVNGVSTIYPANSNVEVKFLESDIWELTPTSDNSILALSGFPGALGTYYSWLEGVKQFSNILFDMNSEDMYTKWNQGNQGTYQVQYAQYTNCIFWSDNPYINDVSIRTNYTLYNSAQMPLCYSNIPDNTFKAFYLALGVVNDPNWSNSAYKESFAKATWATQVFSYYGARIVGIPEHFSIVLPKDCRGLMFYARNTEAAGTFDATNVTNFGAKSGSWREAFGYCSSLRRLYITNLKVSLNVSWSPIDYESIYYIISNAANTSAITISVSPYTYNLLSQSDFDLATSKNITIALISTNYVEDKRLSQIANKADKTYVDEKITDLINSAPETLDTLGELATAFQENDEVINTLNEAITTKADKTYVDELIANIPTESDIVIIDCPDGSVISHTFEQIMAAIDSNKAVYASVYSSNIMPLTHVASDNSFIEFNSTGFEIDENQIISARIDSLKINSDNTFNISSADLLSRRHNEIQSPDGEKDIITVINQLIEKSNNAILKTSQELTDEEAAQVRENIHNAGQNTTGIVYTINDSDVTAGEWAEVFNNYTDNIASGKYSHAENYQTIASGSYSHAEGYGTQATAAASHTEGYDTKATARYAHAEGASTTASGNNSHAEGNNTTSSGHYSHAEGNFTTAAGGYSHAEGNYTSTGIDATYAHAEGSYAKANATGAHAEGNYVEANGIFSHAEGNYTIANSMHQHVQGKYNIADSDTVYAHIVGNGDASIRSNAHTLDWDGNAWFAGDVYTGSTSGINKDEGSKKLATEEYVNIRVPIWTAEDEGKVLKIINGQPTWTTLE